MREKTAKGKGRVDIMHYHMSVFGQLDGTWPQAEKHYRNIMKADAAVNFVTVVREPRQHLLSYYYYFMQPNTQVRCDINPTLLSRENKRKRQKKKKPASRGVQKCLCRRSPMSSRRRLQRVSDIYSDPRAVSSAMNRRLVVASTPGHFLAKIGYR